MVSFKNKPLAKISGSDVERYKRARTDSGITCGTVNRELTVLSHLFTKAVEWRWIDFKPAVLKRLKEDRGRITYLTTDQARRLIEAAEQDQNPYIHPFIVIGIETSMRKMEILSIRLDHIDLDKRLTPKSRTGRAVSIEKAFRRVVRKAGLDPGEVMRHTLRHTASIHLVQAGVDLPTVQRVSGHKTLQMVVRYSHQNGEHIRTATDKLEERYRAGR